MEDKIKVVNEKGVIFNDKTLLIDADTIVFATCITEEVEEQLLPRDFYSDEHWEEVTKPVTYNKETKVLSKYDEDTETVYTIDLARALDKVKDKLDSMMTSTGTSKYELHFTVGRGNFRYDIASDYKANRADKRVPIGNAELKELVSEELDSVYLWSNVEADDAVVSKYNADTEDKYILCAIDKDVLYNCKGTHWNYYSSASHSIDSKWLVVTDVAVLKQVYIQMLMGDSSDGIKTHLYRVGAKTAEKILKDCTTKEECLKAVIDTYTKQADKIAKAITDKMCITDKVSVIKSNFLEYTGTTLNTDFNTITDAVYTYFLSRPLEHMLRVWRLVSVTQYDVATDTLVLEELPRWLK